jgi:hypothetical protein
VFASHINGQGSEETKLTVCVLERIDFDFFEKMENAGPVMGGNIKPNTNL